MIFLDTETTGLEPGSRIIELGSVRVDDAGQVVDTFHRMINPQMPLPADALSVNRITKDMLDAAPVAADAFRDWMDWIDGEQFAAAHFSPYDMGVISWGMGRAGMHLPTLNVIDTCEMAKAIKETANNKLQTLVEHYQIKVEGEAHRAIADCHACRLYYDIAKGLTKPIARPWLSGHEYATPASLPASLAGLPEAVATGAPLSFGYTDASGVKSDRTITAYGWALVRGEIQFHGLCHLRNERRTFNASRVTA